VLAPQLKESFQRAYERAAQNTQSVYATLFPKAMRLERAFVKAGGMLVAGTDPTGSGGVVPGYADQRQIELLVEAGFTPLEAISIGTLHGATYLGREARIGSIAIGKQADIVVVDGDPSARIADISVAKDLLETLAPPKRLLADKAYDADHLRDWLKVRRVQADAKFKQAAASESY
jgi:enamidase